MSAHSETGSSQASYFPLYWVSRVLDCILGKIWKGSFLETYLPKGEQLFFPSPCLSLSRTRTSLILIHLICCSIVQSIYFSDCIPLSSNLPSQSLTFCCFFPALSWGSEKAVGPHSSTLAWKIPWAEKPGRLQSMGWLRVGHDWVTSLSLFTFMHWRRKWQPTPVFLPGESQGQGSLVGCRLSGTESDTTEET